MGFSETGGAHIFNYFAPPSATIAQYKVLDSLMLDAKALKTINANNRILIETEAELDTVLSNVAFRQSSEVESKSRFWI